MDGNITGSESWFSAPPATTLSGSERFVGCDANVTDFWAFAMSDLRMNNVRGYLAEFLVAKAVGASGGRVEWDAYDVLSPEGIRIEVKSSAHLQVWDQRRLSRIVFTGLRGRTWTPQDCSKRMDSRPSRPTLDYFEGCLLNGDNTRCTTD